LSITRPYLDWLKQCFVAALYAGIGYATLHYLKDGDLVSVFWPGSGLALAALVIGGKRYLFGIFFGALALNTLFADSFVTVIGMTAANAFEALVGFWLLNKNGPFFLKTIKDYLRLILAGGAIGSIVGAALGVSTLWINGIIASDDYAHSFIHWWMGDTLGVLLLAPLILVWHPIQFNAIKINPAAEGAVLLGITFIAGQIIFLGSFHDLIDHAHKGYLLFFCIAVVAIRLGLHGTTLTLGIIALQGLLGAYHHIGYFNDELSQANLHNYWLYMVVLSTVGMSLALYVREIQRQLQSLQLKDAALNAAANGILITDADGNIEWANQSFTALTGYTLDEAIGVNPRELVKSEKHIKAFYKPLWDAILTNKSWHGELINRRKDGSLYHEEMTVTPITDEHGTIHHFVAVKQNITERKLLEERIQHLAFYDPLTNLPNRRLLNDRLAHAIASNKRTGCHGAVIFLDLDNFKPLNDTYGHEAGDLLLIEVARRIKSSLRASDTAARFGGDEFIVLLSEMSDSSAESAEIAAVIAEKIRHSLEHPYRLNIPSELSGDKITDHCCTSSIGIALFHTYEMSQDEIFMRADAAMYQAKAEGKNQIRFFHLTD